MADRKFYASKEELEGVYNYYLSAKKTAEYFGVCKKTILYWMKKYNLERHQAKLRKEFYESVFKLYSSSSKMTAKWAGREIGLSDCTINKIRKELGITQDKYHKGYKITWNGYLLLYKPDYSNTDSVGYVRAHRYVMEQHLNRHLLPEEIIHHKDENKLNNSLDNLQIMTKEEHIKLHKPNVKI